MTTPGNIKGLVPILGINAQGSSNIINPMFNDSLVLGSLISFLKHMASEEDISATIFITTISLTNGGGKLTSLSYNFGNGELYADDHLIFDGDTDRFSFLIAPLLDISNVYSNSQLATGLFFNGIGQPKTQDLAIKDLSDTRIYAQINADRSADPGLVDISNELIFIGMLSKQGLFWDL